MLFFSGEVPTGESADPIHEALENVGVHVGGRTQRDRLLSKLSRHVTRKRPRMSTGIVSDITPKFSRGKPQRRDALDCDPSEECHFQEPVENSKDPDSNDIDQDQPFSQFGNYDLVNMIRGVGIDADGWDRDKLISTCEAYKELSEIPTSFSTWIKVKFYF